MPSKLSIIIPVYNEQTTIREILARVFAANVGEWARQIIVVNDGSTDNTLRRLEELNKEFNFKLINLPGNQGKGSAIQAGLDWVSGDYVIIQDADLEYNPVDYGSMLASTTGDNIVYGSRNLKPKMHGYFVYTLGGRFLTALINRIWQTKLTDINTGYKLIPTQLLREFNLSANRFDFCEEVTIKALRRGYNIIEVPISYEPRSFKQGKKIRWYDGLRAVITIIKLSYL